MKNKLKVLLTVFLTSSLTSCDIFLLPSNSDEIEDDKLSSDEFSEQNSSLESNSVIEESSPIKESESISHSESNDPIVSGSSHSNTGTSIDFLNVAFNGNSNHYTFDTLHTTQVVEGATRLNFTKNVQTLQYNEGYVTPSTGNINSLVIPVDFPDNYMSNNESRTASKPDWESVSSFYYNSSYGQLNISFDILDWYTCKNNASYYEKLKSSKFSGEVPGVSAIIDEALSYYSKSIDLSKYDNDNDGCIDSLYIIYNHAIDYDNGDFWWAYQYAFLEENEYNGISPYNYIFAGYDFFFEDDSFGNASKCNTHTLIHETGHMLGLEDYYDYDEKQGYNKGGFGGADLMDSTVGDHNGFSKIALGWINNPILVNFDSNEHEYIDIALKPFESSGDVIMICDNFDSSKEMFQSYFLLEYYTNTMLHEYDQIYGSNGVRLLRVNGELTTYSENDYSYEYFKYDNSYASRNLIDVVCASKTKEGVYSAKEYTSYCADESDLYVEGSSRDTLYYTSKTTSAYSFKVISLSAQEAIIRIYKK